MSECAVETCRRPGTVCVDRNDPPEWVLCQQCWMCLISGAPYIVRAVWEGATLVGFLALQRRPPAQDDQGPILQA